MDRKSKKWRWKGGLVTPVDLRNERKTVRTAAKKRQRAKIGSFYGTAQKKILIFVKKVVEIS